MNTGKLTPIVAVLLLLSACGHSGDDPPREFTLTLTAIDAVKEGGDETVPIAGTPVDGATLTR